MHHADAISNITNNNKQRLPVQPSSINTEIIKAIEVNKHIHIASTFSKTFIEFFIINNTLRSYLQS